jgi:hypothetical protein
VKFLYVDGQFEPFSDFPHYLSQRPSPVVAPFPLPRTPVEASEYLFFEVVLELAADPNSNKSFRKT